MTTTIQVRVDEDLKQKSDRLFRELGTDTTSAIRIFLSQAVACDGFPFQVRRAPANPFPPLTEEEFLQKLATARVHAEQGMVRNADEVISDLRAQYGL